MDIQDRKGATILHKAVSIGDYDLIELILRQSPRIALRDINGKIAFDRAAKKVDHHAHRLYSVFY